MDDWHNREHRTIVPFPIHPLLMDTPLHYKEDRLHDAGKTPKTEPSVGNAYKISGTFSCKSIGIFPQMFFSSAITFLLRTSAILPEAISAGGLTPTTDTSLFLTTYRGGSHLPANIMNYMKNFVAF